MNDNERMLRLCLAAISNLAEDRRSIDGNTRARELPVKDMFQIVTAGKADYSPEDRERALFFMREQDIIERIEGRSGIKYRLTYPFWWHELAVALTAQPEVADAFTFPPSDAIKQWLHDLRGHRSLTVAAAELGVSTSALQRYETGERTPSYHRAYVWAARYPSFPRLLAKGVPTIRTASAGDGSAA